MEYTNKQLKAIISAEAKNYITNLQALADGGLVTEDCEWVPAGSCVFKNGDLMFPNEEPTELICIKKVTRKLAPNLTANIHLLDRTMGKVATEVPDTDGEGESIELTIDMSGKNALKERNADGDDEDQIHQTPSLQKARAKLL